MKKDQTYKICETMPKMIKINNKSKSIYIFLDESENKNKNKILISA